MNLLYYSETCKLRTNDFDNNDKIKPSAILDLFQDIAGSHGTEIGVGFHDTLKLGYFWVLVRTRIDILKPLSPLSLVKVSTWTKEKGKIDCDREYLIEDLEGNTLVSGISKWVIIDSNTRRICRTDKINFNGDTYYANNNYDGISKLSLPVNSLFKEVSQYKVLKRDVDHNLHMNNAKYADLILDIFPEFEIKSMQMEYISESKEGTIIKLFEYRLDNKFYYQGYNNDKLSFTALVEVNI